MKQKARRWLLPGKRKRSASGAFPGSRRRAGAPLSQGSKSKQKISSPQPKAGQGFLSERKRSAERMFPRWGVNTPEAVRKRNHTERGGQRSPGCPKKQLSPGAYKKIRVDKEREKSRPLKTELTICLCLNRGQPLLYQKGSEAQNACPRRGVPDPPRRACIRPKASRKRWPKRDRTGWPAVPKKKLLKANSPSCSTLPEGQPDICLKESAVQSDTPRWGAYDPTRWAWIRTRAPHKRKACREQNGWPAVSHRPKAAVCIRPKGCERSAE